MRARLLPACFATVLAVVFLSCAGARAGEIVLKDGTILKGGYPVFLATVDPKVLRPDPEKSVNLAILTMNESGAVQFFVSRHFAASWNKDETARPPELFKLPQVKRPRTRHIKEVAGQIDATIWDKHGHRSATFKSGNQTVSVMQEIIELTPKYATVVAMDYHWQFSIPTASIPSEALQQILHQASKVDNADDRFAIARFYLEGEFYPLAQQELQSIRADFPDRATDVDALMAGLKQALADQALNILDERRQAGQHQLAFDTAQKFLALNLPDVSEVTLQKLRKSVAQAESERTRMEEVRQLLGQLQAALPADQAKEVAPLRLEIAAGLHVETLDRLAPFLDLADDESRKPSEKLALALTGWIMGADRADTDLKGALRLWQARALIKEYFRAENSAERAAVVAKLVGGEGVEGVEGVGPQQVARLIPLLPPRIEMTNLTPGVPFTVTAERRGNSEAQVKYDVLLPLEYHVGRAYPVVVALHAEGMDSNAELKWWARQAQRGGYIVLAPQYIEPGQRYYDYGLDAHHAVLETIRDAGKRFVMDSDRIFLGGHGIGGDAVFDIGYSHPDIFAGIMPITALCEKFSTVYYENARHLPQFIIAGELDRNALEYNSGVIDHMLVGKFPIIYAVLEGRGHEDFHSEDGRLFEWMSRQRRAKPPLEIAARTARTTDNRFWWWTFSNFPAKPTKFGITTWPEGANGQSKQVSQAKPIVLSVSAKRAKGDNVINIQSTARFHALWLFPDVVSFEKTLTVRQGPLQLYREIPEPDITAMLEDFRLRGDRQQIAWGYLELGTAARPATSEAQLPAKQSTQRLSLRPR